MCASGVGNYRLRRIRMYVYLYGSISMTIKFTDRIISIYCIVDINGPDLCKFCAKFPTIRLSEDPVMGQYDMIVNILRIIEIIMSIFETGY